MDAKTFNENYEIDRQSKGVKATAKNFSEPEVKILTADGTAYDPNQTYFFFEIVTKNIRKSDGFRRECGFLIGFGLKVVHIGQLRANLDDALADGQQFFNREIERLRDLVRDYETKKTSSVRSLKAVLMSG